MISHISVCGDSFGLGSGISMDPHEMINQSFGAVVASRLNLPLKMYARSGCCNFVIYLQVKKIIEQYNATKELPLVLVTTTNHSRFCFPLNGEPNYVEYDLADVDYLSYAQPFRTEEEYRNFLPFKLNDSPKLISETVSNVMYHIKNRNSSLSNLFKHVRSKISYIKNYFEVLYSDNIKNITDSSLITTMHLELKEAGIPHLIMAPNFHQFRFIDKDNFFCQDWGHYSRKYPDAFNSGHCTSTGHLETANDLLEKIKTLNLQ